jgi:hypothetical protein
LIRGFEPDFSLLLRERRFAYFTRMQDDAIEIESNMMASGKLKDKLKREIKKIDDS